MAKITRLERPNALWATARWIVLLATIGLIVGFWVSPEGSLSVLWYVLIPILPAVFLVNVEVWRNVCPLATLNVLTGSSVGSRLLDREAARIAGLLGIGLLVLLVPARRFLFNTHGEVLAVSIRTARCWPSRLSPCAFWLS